MSIIYPDSKGQQGVKFQDKIQKHRFEKLKFRNPLFIEINSF